MNNKATYKRVKNHWWIFPIFTGYIVWMIFAYIHQWGINPISKAGLIIFPIIFILFGLTFMPRYKLIINDNFAIFHFNNSDDVKISISMIKNVTVKQVVIMEFYYYRNLKYQFDFLARKAVCIETKSGKVYQIAIKNAEKIKEEIEKRMLIEFKNDEQSSNI